MLNKNNIQLLVKRSKNQEWAAQKELYLLYADEMMSIAIRYVRDQASAKDLVQETFLTFFNKIEMYDEKKGSLGAWISRILINRALNDYRKNQKIIFVNEEIFTSEISIETSIIETLEAQDILNLLQELPEGCCMIFNLHVIEGYKHAEIGKMLGITSSASRSQLTRAKKLLRQLIENKAISHNYSKVAGK